MLALLIFASLFATIGYRQLHKSHALSYDRSVVIWIASSQVGTTEFSPQVLQFTDGNKEAWCTDFISWVFLKAGHPFKGGINDWRIPLVYQKVDGVLNLRDYFNYLHAYRTKESGYHATPGDVVLFTRNGADHAGIVVETSSTGIKTVEGNIGGTPGAASYVAAGDKVAVNLHTWDDPKIDGYGVWLPLSSGSPNISKR